MMTSREASSEGVASEDVGALARGLVTDVGALAQAELRRTEHRARAHAARAARAAALGTLAAVIAVVGVLAVSGAAGLALFELGLEAPAALALVGAADLLVAGAIARRAATLPTPEGDIPS